MTTPTSTSMLRNFLIVLTVLLGVIMLGPYVGIHVLGTRPSSAGASLDVDAAERRPPRTSEPARASDKTAAHPPVKPAPGGKDAAKSEGRLSEIEQLLK